MCIVEVNGKESQTFKVPLGCVQGSVLGPKLFNLYTRNIMQHLTPNAYITTYVDDSYVITSAPRDETLQLINEAENCLAKHVQYLRSLWMVVNRSKTEFMVLGDSTDRPDELKFDRIRYLSLNP
jgi:hypothetical protein